VSKDKDIETIWLDTFDSNTIDLTQIGNIVIDSTDSMVSDYWSSIISGADYDTLTIGGGGTDIWTSSSYPINQEVVLSAGGEEMIKITPEGFWVRGVKVEQDSKEAQAVYEAFRRWQTAQILNSDSEIIIK